MNILHMKYAVEVANTGSINKASEVLFVGQPNLSRAIRELEASLGITIFNRSARGMFPTPDGEEFLTHARQILKHIDDVEAMYKNRRPVTETFSLSAPRASYIAQAFANFSRCVGRDSVELYYHETNSMGTINNILQSDYGLGIVRYHEKYDRYFRDMLEEKNLSYEVVSEFSNLLIMSRSHPLASKDEILLSDLRPYIKVAHADPYVPSLPPAEVKRSEIADDTDRLIFVYERASQFEILSINTEAFMWGSPMDAKLLDRYDLVQRECSDDKKIYKDVLISRKDHVLSHLDQIFISELHKALPDTLL